MIGGPRLKFLLRIFVDFPGAILGFESFHLPLALPRLVSNTEIDTPQGPFWDLNLFHRPLGLRRLVTNREIDTPHVRDTVALTCLLGNFYLSLV